MNLYVHRYTEGSRVFLGIHGWGGDHREFAPLAARAPSDARLLSVDLPGYGRSPLPADWTLRGVGATLGATLAGEGGGTIIGFCSGAILALLAAQARPEAIRRIVMIDPFGYVPFYFRLFTWGALGRFFYRWAFVGAVGRAVVNRTLRRRQRAEADFTAAFERVNHDVTLEYLRRFARLGRLEQFANLRAPMAIAYGEHTFRAVRRSVERMRRLWPTARAECLAGVGHLPMARGADALRRLVFEEVPATPRAAVY